VKRHDGADDGKPEVVPLVVAQARLRAAVKTSKMSGRSSARIPMPVSAIAMSAHPLGVRAKDGRKE
jgi:hypothetical protein